MIYASVDLLHPSKMGGNHPENWISYNFTDRIIKKDNKRLLQVKYKLRGPIQPNYSGKINDTGTTYVPEDQFIKDTLIKEGYL